MSHESAAIFDLILELHHSCDGKWNSLLDKTANPDAAEHLEKLHTYAALVLYNQGNYYGYGDKKFVPGVPVDFLETVAKNASARAVQLLRECKEPMLSTEPGHLGYPSEHAQSAYYPGPEPISQEEVDEIDKLLDKNAIGPENTRIAKYVTDEGSRFKVMQACVEKEPARSLGKTASGALVELERGEHAETLKRICESLEKARDNSETDAQKKFLSEYIAYFTCGDIARFKEAQTLWLKDRSPIVESIIGFVEQYRDPAGRRAEFQGVVALTDKEASKTLRELVEASEELISGMPWVRYFKDRDGMGPFESDRFEAPEFTAIHGMYARATQP